MYDGTGTYDPLPDGTAYSFGYREDRALLGRMLRQVYRDFKTCEASAFHVAKRLHEQLTGLIDQRQVRHLLSPPLKNEAPSLTEVTDQEAEDRELGSVIG